MECRLRRFCPKFLARAATLWCWSVPAVLVAPGVGSRAPSLLCELDQLR